MVDNTTNKIGEKNPYRYRSYYYDTETTWYYLNSWYYDTNIGRFITMDEIEYLGATSTILSYNLFTYCDGNPVNRVDSFGTCPEWLDIDIEEIKRALVVAAVAVVAVAATVATAGSAAPILVGAAIGV